MDNRDKSKSLTSTSLDEDSQGRGLRILGRMIARNLMKQRKGNENMAGERKPDDLPTAEDEV